ncbi:DUF4350 domain-containing protein [Gordonia desulfuricans]|uniref:DUF4350 domain-containing protein n=1 Tax=Gordonia desulfuricans TaxID=89051 RepID=UPI00073EBE59|nr:DUF4350 domain-containing protein [Gordonia desulfuricans]
MTAPAPAQESSPPPVPAAPRTRRRIGLWVGIPVIVLLLVAVIAVVVLVGGTAARDKGNQYLLDPQNYGATGTSVLASIIDDHGVQVTIVRGLADLRVTPKPDAHTTVVVSNTAVLRPDTAAAFADRVREADRIVLLSPSSGTLSLLDWPIDGDRDPGIVPPGDSVAAGCTAAGIDPGDVVTARSYGYRAFDAGPPAAGAHNCFRVGDAAQVAIAPDSLVGPDLVALNASMTTNEQIESFDNAGVSVRLLANTDRILWYIPQADDVASASEEQSILPRFIGPAFLLAFFVVVALALWRGRRFGPVATEPLPAVVRAIETTRSRGRLYRRAADASRTAAILRVHTLDRLSGYLGLPYDPGRAIDAIGAVPVDDPAVTTICDAVTTITGRDLGQVSALLAGPLPADDAGLLTFTTELTTLEKEVRRTP